MDFKKLFSKDKNSITIQEDGIIPYNEIGDLKDLTFVVTTKDMVVLENVIKSITDFHKEHKDMNINVVISSSYTKLHELSNGLF